MNLSDFLLPDNVFFRILENLLEKSFLDILNSNNIIYCKPNHDIGLDSYKQPFLNIKSSVIDVIKLKLSHLPNISLGAVDLAYIIDLIPTTRSDVT